VSTNGILVLGDGRFFGFLLGRLLRPRAIRRNCAGSVGVGWASNRSRRSILRAGLVRLRNAMNKRYLLKNKES
jgi:hypothetical protein